MVDGLLMGGGMGEGLFNGGGMGEGLFLGVVWVMSCLLEEGCLKDSCITKSCCQHGQKLKKATTLEFPL